MKWPKTLTVIRHGESAYNALREQKEADPEYQEFKKAYNRRKADPERAQKLARAIFESRRFRLPYGDHDTPLTQEGQQQAEKTGRAMLEQAVIPLPDVIFVSPYKRTYQTLEGLTRGWPELADVKTVEEERIREKNHGLAVLYNDWRIFQTLFPEQGELRQAEGPYWYRHPQGESIPDVRLRHGAWLGAITRDYVEKNVLAVSHHLSMLALRANLERMGAKEFIDLDENNKPVNCGLTIYDGNPDAGNDGHLDLRIYNQQLY